MAILIDKRIQKFVEGFLHGENDEIISIHLKDIDETFWFNSEVAAQEFLNKQATERAGDPELRTDSFDYTDEEGMLHRYLLGGVNRRGEIISYLEEIVNKYTEDQLYEEYGYLMDKTHGNDTKLLMDIMKCNGLEVEEKNGKYLVIDK